MTKYKTGVIGYIQQWVKSEPKPIKEVETYTEEIISQRMTKFNALHGFLCDKYDTKTTLLFFITAGEPKPSDRSCFIPISHIIEIRGKFSLLTYLHEFAHSLGKDEAGSREWSQNLFQRALPQTFARLQSHDDGLTFRGGRQ